MTRARDVANLIGSGNFSSTTFTATAGQTAFTISHTQGFVQVFMNGLLLDETVDYTSNGSAITLTSGAAAGDEIEVVKYNTFSVGDALPKSGGSMTGALTVDDDGATVLTVDRATSDGTVIDIQKDGTSVGNIAARVGHLRIGNDDIGLEFHKTNNAIYPANLTAGTLPDNTTDLGASNIRFKDIYTSGGIYLGAASNSTPVAANYLDDYEYGTWTPVLQGNTTAGTLSGTSGGRYTKLGQAVHLEFRINNVTLTGAAGAIKITGLPFRSTYGPQNSYAVCPISFMYKFNFEHTRRQALYLGNNTTYMLGMESRANTTWTDWLISNNNAMYMNGQFTYITDQ